jgi:hypothetical protein
MRISPVTKSLDELFRGNFLKIPRFQRPYSWDGQNVTDFWNDLADREDVEYFMGSAVLFADGKEKNLLSIVDGQQRLTTITIALSLVRSKFDQLGEPELADGIQAVLERKDIDNKLRYVLEHEPKNSYFQKAIQQRRPDEAAKPSTVEEKSLAAALASLSESLTADVDMLIPAEEQIERVKTLRNRLLALLFISIQLDDEDDAYLIFETLNTRGKDLRVSDLLKNYFTRLIKPKNKSQDETKASWQEIMRRLEGVNPPIESDTFLTHYWLSEFAYVSKQNLFKAMKGVIAGENAKSVLNQLVQAAPVYVQSVAPSSHKWDNEEARLKKSLAALQAFRVAQATPLILAIMRKYRTKVISLAAAHRAIEYVEKFAFIFNAVTQSRGGGGIANMYARLAQKVTAADTPQAFADISSEIQERLVDKVNSQEEFTLGFLELSFRSDYTRERGVVRYALGKFAELYGLPAETDMALMTIEHIRPESSYSSQEEFWQVARIGNLLFAPERVNARLKTKRFAEKKEILLQEGMPLDPFLSKATDWKLSDIDARARELAAEGYKKIWWI